MSLFFDTHCHLVTPPLVNQLESLLLPSLKDKFLTVGTVPSDWQATMQLADYFPQVYSALGLHPWFVHQNYLTDIRLLENILSSDNSITALGEIGLDFSSNHRGFRQQQLSAFEMQIGFAKKFNLPVSIHCYKAYNETLQLLKLTSINGFMHGFSGGLELAKQFIKLGFMIGVNSVILNRNARRYHQMVRGIGLAHLVIESDAPFVKDLTEYSPLLLLDKVAQKVADILECSVDEVVEQTRYNAQKILFKES